VAAVLADFQCWLGALAPVAAEPPASTDEGPDLYTLLEQLTALRHEVNLQTRSSRSLQEQNAAVIAELSRAVAALQDAKAARAPDGDDVQRPLLKTLVELYDALAVAGREAQRVQEAVLPLLQESPADLPEAPVWSPPALARWLFPGVSELVAYRNGVAAWRASQKGESRGEAFDKVRRLLASLTAGYAMSLQRVERTLRQHGLETVAGAGEPFDPERMEAVEAVTDSGHPSGRVIDEVQRGYLWKGRVFRFAKVRVAK
jgi:molecular chaperone GrpE